MLLSWSSLLLFPNLVRNFNLAASAYFFPFAGYIYIGTHSLPELLRYANASALLHSSTTHKSYAEEILYREFRYPQVTQ